MTASIRDAALALIAAAALLACSPPARAQGGPACAAPVPLPDGNVLLSCHRLRIEIEQGADFKLSDRPQDGQPRGGTLRSGAVYIEDQSQGGRDAFQIRTPDAIASVRGTTWAVDVTPKLSSVFVVKGVVAVMRGNDRQTVSLSAGDGVDVAPEAGPLVVKRWGAERVAALLARFGR